MGGGNSKPAENNGGFGRGSAYPNPSYGYPYPNPGIYQYGQNYGPAQPQGYGEPPVAYPPPPSGYGRTSSYSQQNPPQRNLDRRYSRITDGYNSVDEVTQALAKAGLESSNLIIGVDFTKSNEWTGKHSFQGRSLHHVGDVSNPYEQAISIIGRTLSAFDEDNLIPCFGFGDASTHDQDVFSFYPDGRPCNGFAEALERYRELVPQLRLAGPTSFAPIIEMAMTIVEQNGGQYHVLLIIADGQVTRSVDTASGQLSPQEQMTVDAIVKASEFPLSIVLVGVGDGPWDMMKEFDDNIPARSFDNFQFVNFTEIMSKNMPLARKEAAFALEALMEIPPQYKATIELGILGRRNGKSPGRIPLPPPGTSFYHSSDTKSASFKPSTKAYSGHGSASSMSYESGYDTTYDATSSRTSSAPNISDDSQLCPICLTNRKDMAFGCGHQTCSECGPSLQLCPLCRSEIVTRIKLY